MIGESTLTFFFMMVMLPSFGLLGDIDSLSSNDGLLFSSVFALVPSGSATKDLGSSLLSKMHRNSAN